MNPPSKRLNTFRSEHGDTIRDISYDYYGKRLATASSDHSVHIWDQVPGADGDATTWQRTATIKAHNGGIWTVAWAHPEFGQLIATCSEDRSVNIWEEPDRPFVVTGNTDVNPGSWIQRATLVDSRDDVMDVKFAPRHHGLKIATCSKDGFVRIYEAMDVMNLQHWSLVEEFEAQKRGSGPIDDSGVTCCSWNPSVRDAPPMMVVGTKGLSDNLKIWSYNTQHRKWQEAANLSGHNRDVQNVSWAPNMGRPYHLIASASQDQTVRIWKVELHNGVVNATEIQCLLDHHAPVWQVNWNITGTILASSGDDGTVKLWKARIDKGTWECIQQVKDAP